MVSMMHVIYFNETPIGPLPFAPMFRLADKGHEVVGIEGSEVAAKQFGEDHHLQYNVLPIEGTSIVLYKVGITIADHIFMVASVELNLRVNNVHCFSTIVPRVYQMYHTLCSLHL